MATYGPAQNEPTVGITSPIAWADQPAHEAVAPAYVANAHGAYAAVAGGLLLPPSSSSVSTDGEQNVAMPYPYADASSPGKDSPTLAHEMKAHGLVADLFPLSGDVDVDKRFVALMRPSFFIKFADFLRDPGLVMSGREAGAALGSLRTQLSRLMSVVLFGLDQEPSGVQLMLNNVVTVLRSAASRLGVGSKPVKMDEYRQPLPPISLPELRVRLDRALLSVATCSTLLDEDRRLVIKRASELLALKKRLSERDNESSPSKRRRTEPNNGQPEHVSQSVEQPSQNGVLLQVQTLESAQKACRAAGRWVPAMADVDYHGKPECFNAMVTGIHALLQLFDIRRMSPLVDDLRVQLQELYVSEVRDEYKLSSSALEAVAYNIDGMTTDMRQAFVSLFDIDKLPADKYKPYLANYRLKSQASGDAPARVVAWAAWACVALRGSAAPEAPVRAGMEPDISVILTTQCASYALLLIADWILNHPTHRAVYDDVAILYTRQRFGFGTALAMAKTF